MTKKAPTGKAVEKALDRMFDALQELEFEAGGEAERLLDVLLPFLDELRGDFIALNYEVESGD